MSDASAIFSGTSRYSSDFQSVIERAVGIASLPLVQLTNKKTGLTAESDALARLHTKVDAVRTAVSNLSQALGPASQLVSVSDPGTVRAMAGSGAEAGSHTIEVTSLGCFTSTLSADTCAPVADPSACSISTASAFTLTVDGRSVEIAPGENTLSALASAINGSGLDVRAVAVNIGTSGEPDYRLSVQGTRLAPATIQLTGAGTDLLDTLATGAEATYKLDGSAVTLRSESRTVEAAPGLTVQLLRRSEPGMETAITVTRNTAGIAGAMNAFCSAYNAAMTELDSHRGKSNGALAGQSIVRTVTEALRQCAGGPASVELGLSFDQTGTLSFDPAASAAASGAAGEFLDAAGSFLDGIPLETEQESVSAQIRAQDDRITAEQARIDELRGNLVAQMSAADALIASLEQQVAYVTNMFDAMRTAAKSYE